MAIHQVLASFALVVFLLPTITFAGCKDSDCLRACRSCERPSPKNGSAHCPSAGYDCDATGTYPYDFTIDAGKDGRDCLKLICTGSRSLFVRGQLQPYLACFQGGWRLPGGNEEFLESTDGAICLRKCDQNPCMATVTAKYKAEGFIDAIIVPPMPYALCGSAYCADGPWLYGAFRNSREPVAVPPGSLICTGSGQWKDEESGGLFDFPACRPQCRTCTEQSIDTTPNGPSTKDFASVRINLDGACSSLILNCTTIPSDDAMIDLNNGEIPAVTGKSYVTVTLDCNWGGTGWIYGESPSITRAICLGHI